MTIGERIALLRKQAGLSQEKLASLIGVSRQAIGKWESNLSLPGIDNLQELAAVLHVSCDELITGASPIGPNNDGNGQIALESVKKLIEQGELANRQNVRRRFLFSLLPALLACVLALGCLAVSYFSFSQIQALEDRLSSLDAAIAVLQNPVYLGTDSGGTANQSSLINDFDRRYTPLPGRDSVQLRVSVLPKNLEEGQSARFSLIADGQNLTVPASMQGGEFWAELEIPLTNEFNFFKVSFLLDRPDGGTEQELLFTEAEFITQYTLRLVLEPDDFSALPQSDGSWIAGGRMALTVECSENRYPVAGMLALVIDGKTVQTEPMDERIFDSFLDEGEDTAPEQAAAVAGFTSYHRFELRRYKASRAGAITVRATITDNLGKEHTAEWTAG